ncbi:MAG: 50S ribosomal protein L21 [Gemmatimonadales bacterium]|nr:50S ribosomal protein L21 [Gemmatimonadales bacterium]
MYVIFKAKGKQFKAEEGMTLRLPRFDAEPGATITFDEVLLASKDDKITAGAPLVKGASVTAEVIREGKGEKIYVFRFKRRKNIRRKTGHREKFTEVRITGVKVG